MSSLDFKVRINTIVEGIKSVEDLLAELQKIINLTASSIPDPTKLLTTGAKQAADALITLNTSVSKIKPMGKSLPNITDEFSKGLKKASIEVKTLQEDVKTFNTTAGQASREGLQDLINSAEALKEAPILEGAASNIKAITEETQKLTRGLNMAHKLALSFVGALSAYVSIQGLRSLMTYIYDIGAGYELSMARVGAVTRATANEFTMLDNTAKKMGASTEFTAKQAADGLVYLGMAGFNAAQAAAALPGTLNLATAGMMDLGQAADITTNILTAMRLPVEDLAHVNDVLVRTFTTANTDMLMLGEAFKYAAPKAAAYGYSIEEVSGLLGQLANNGIRGSMGGTQLNFAFSKVSDTFAKFGQSAYKATGETKNLIDAVELLRDVSASPAMVTDLFGERGGRAVNALLGVEQANKGALRRYITEELGGAVGAAQQIADRVRGTTKISFDLLKSAVEDVFLGSWRQGQAALQGALTSLTSTVSAATPQLTQLSSAVMALFVSMIKVVNSGVKFVSWLQEIGVISIGTKAAMVALAISGVKFLIGSLARLGAQTLALKISTLQLSVVQAGSAVATNAQAASVGRLSAAFSFANVRAGVFAATSRLLGGALALVGGPIGLAVTALVGLGVAVHEYTQRQKKNRQAIIDSIPVLEEKSKAVQELTTAWRNLNIEESKGKHNSSERLQWVDDALTKYPELSDSIKALGTDYKAITKVIEDFNAKSFKDFVENQKADLQLVLSDLKQQQKALAELKAPGGNIDKTFIGGGISGIAMSGRIRSDEEMQKLYDSVQREIDIVEGKIKARISDIAKKYAQFAVDNNQIMVEARANAQKEMLSIFANTDADPAKISKITKQLFEDFYSNIKAGVAANIEGQSPNIESLLQVEFSRTESLLRQFGEKLSGSQILDLSQAIGGLEASRDSFHEFITELTEKAQAARFEIEKEMAKLDPGTEQYRRAEAAYKAYTARLLEYEKQKNEGLLELDTKFYADQVVHWKEVEEGSKLTAEARKKVYEDAVESFVKGEQARVKAAIEANFKVKEDTLAKMSDIINVFSETAIAGTSAGQAILNAVKNMHSSLVKDLEQNKTLKLNKLVKIEESQLERIKKSLTAGMGGTPKKSSSVKGGAVNDDGLNDFKTRLAEEKRMLVFHAEQANKELQKALRQREISYADYIQRKIDIDRQNSNIEINTIEQTLAKVKELWAKAGASDKGKYTQELLKLENDLTIARAKAAEDFENAFNQAFENIATEYAALQEKLKTRQETINLNVDLGVYSLAQGQRELNKATQELLPTLELITSEFEQMLAHSNSLGFNTEELTMKLLQMQQTNLHNKEILYQTANDINSVVEGAMNSFLSNMARDWRNVTELAKQFVSTVLQGIGEIASKQIASGIMSWLGGGKMGGMVGGVGSLFAGMFADGGLIRGPGTETSDSILARVSTNEFIFSAKAVNTLGAGFLETLHQMGRSGHTPKELKDLRPSITLPKSVAKFVDGGLVGLNTKSALTSPEYNLNTNVSVNIQNAMDEKGLIRTIVNSKEFKDGILRTSNRERRTLQKILGG